MPHFGITAPLLLRSLLTLSLLGSFITAKAQVFEDCFTAIPLCDTLFSQPGHGPGTGQGIYPNEIDPTATCLPNAEDAGYWYVLNTETGGILEFSIVPNNPGANYDFAVYDLTNDECDDIATNPTLEIACNADISPGITGANGLGGPQNEPTIPVVAGGEYVIYISNPGGDNGGYEIQLGNSTAGILDTLPPSILGITGDFRCGQDTVTVTFDEEIFCNTVQPSDFLVIGQGDTIPLSIVSNVNCGLDPNNGHQPIFNLVLSQPFIEDGIYELVVRGPVEDLCGNVYDTDTLNFTVATPPITAVSVSQIYCGDQQIEVGFSDSIACDSIVNEAFILTNFNGDTISVNNAWNPGCLLDTTDQAASVFLDLDSALINIGQAYTLEITDTLTDICGNNLQPATFNPTIASDLVANAGPNLDVCYFEDTVELDGSGSSGSPDLNYQWTPNTGIYTGANSATPQIDPGVTQEYVLTVSNGVCVSEPDTAIVNVILPPNNFSIIQGSNTICLGDSTEVIIDAPAGYSFLWVEAGVVTNTIQLDTTVSVDYNVVPFNETCPGDTFTYPLTVTQTPQGAISVSDATPCTFDTVLVEFVGTPVSEANPQWDVLNGSLVSGDLESYGPLEVVWTDSTSGDLTLSTNTFGCIEEFSIPIQVNRTPQVSAGPDLYRCENALPTPSQSSVLSPYPCTFSWTPTNGLEPNDVNDLQPGFFPSVTTDYSITAFCGGCPSEPDTFTVNVNPAPVAIISQAVLTNCAGQGIEIPGSVSGGTGPISVEWVLPQAINLPYVPNPIVNPDTTTIYGLIATDSLGCSSDTALVQVNVDSLPLVDAGPDQVICSEGTGVQLSGTILNPQNGGYTYSWSPTNGLSNPNSPTTFANPQQTTTYTLTVTNNATGCSSQATSLDSVSSVTVFVVDRPVADAGEDVTICQLDSVQLGDVPYQGNGVYSYRWSPSQGLSDTTAQLPMASPAFTTEYYLTVSAAGCESVADTVLVTVEPRPTLDITTPDTAICPYDSVPVQISFAQVQGDLSFSWSPGVGVADTAAGETFIQPPATGEYILSLSTENCIRPARDTIEIEVIPLPTVDAYPGEEEVFLCLGDSIQLPATASATTPFQILWTPATDLSSNTVLQPLAYPQEPQTYVLNALYNGCVASDSVTVFISDSINAQPNADTNVVCRGEVVRLFAENPPPANYSWAPDTNMSNPNRQEVFVAPDTTRFYTLTVARDGCLGIDSIRIEVVPQPVANFSFGQLGGCAGHRIAFTDLSTEAEAWYWDFGDGSSSNAPNPTHQYDSAGVYQVSLRVSAEGTCEDSAAVVETVVIHPRAQAAFGSTPAIPDTLYLPNASVQFQDSSQAGVEYFWQFGDGQSSFAVNPNHTYEVPGAYEVTLTVTDSAGCTSDTTRGLITVRSPELQVPNVFTPDGDGINDFWRVPYQGTEPVEVYIYDRWGRLVYTGNTLNQVWDGVDDGGTDAVAGVYFYQIIVGDKSYNGTLTLLRGGGN